MYCSVYWRQCRVGSVSRFPNFHCGSFLVNTVRQGSAQECSVITQVKAARQLRFNSSHLTVGQMLGKVKLNRFSLIIK